MKTNLVTTDVCVSSYFDGSAIPIVKSAAVRITVGARNHPGSYRKLNCVPFFI